jgi:hypothetical protein
VTVANDIARRVKYTLERRAEANQMPQWPVSTKLNIGRN